MLGEQFKFDYNKAKSIDENIVQGEKYRFTVLSERLIRLEYSENGAFEDRPTELVWYRNMPKVEFNLVEKGSLIEITTNYFKLTYKKNTLFGTRKSNSNNLKVKLLNSDKIWYYNHPEVRNFGAPGFTLNDDLKNQKGLYSVDGFASIDDSKSKVFNESGILEQGYENHADIYLFMYLKDFNLCLKDYYSITGYPSLIPRYALGNWWCKNAKYNDAELKDLIDSFINNEIPMSILLLDKSWHNPYTEKYVNSFTWNNEYFKNPRSMITYIHTNKMRIGLNINPMNGMNTLDEVNKEVPINVIDEKTLASYFNSFIHPLDNDGIDFYWLNEEKDIQNLFYLSHYHYFDEALNPNKRPLMLTRNTIKAPHRYSITYSGISDVSWDSLKKIPFYNSSATNIGFSFTSFDVGGYNEGIEDNELYVRYVQLGVFSPILKFGSDECKYYKREPWKWGIKTNKIASEYLKLRHRLIPYIYTEAYKHHKYGQPLIMPIYYFKPEFYDDDLYKNEYFFGSEMFVAPILSKKDYVMDRVIHKFYLPDGVWYDFITGKKFIGDKEYISFFKDEDYPVYVKEGAILPLGTNDELNDTTVPNNLSVQIFPGSSNSYTMYEDDGVTNKYKQNNYLLTKIDYEYKLDDYTVFLRTIEGKTGVVPERRNYKIIFRNTKKVTEVTAYYNNTQLQTNCYSKGSNFIVELSNVPSIGQIAINCKGKDIKISDERIIKDDVVEIISSLQIETKLKMAVDEILFSDIPSKKKRIEIRKLTKQGLESKFVKLFFKLLEYLDNI